MQWNLSIVGTEELSHYYSHNSCHGPTCTNPVQSPAYNNSLSIKAHKIAATIIDRFHPGYFYYQYIFSILHTQIDITAPRSLQVHFINGSPVVEGNTVRVDIMATVPGASFMCELLRKNSSSMMADCEW